MQMTVIEENILSVVHHFTVEKQQDTLYFSLFLINNMQKSVLKKTFHFFYRTA